MRTAPVKNNVDLLLMGVLRHGATHGYATITEQVASPPVSATTTTGQSCGPSPRGPRATRLVTLQ
jgi:hypothetical protein